MFKNPRSQRWCDCTKNLNRFEGQYAAAGVVAVETILKHLLLNSGYLQQHWNVGSPPQNQSKVEPGAARKTSLFQDRLISAGKRENLWETWKKRSSLPRSHGERITQESRGVLGNFLGLILLRLMNSDFEIITTYKL